MQDFAVLLKNFRKGLGKSQQEMAGFVGIPQRTYANYENGTSQPKVNILIKLAEKGFKMQGVACGAGSPSPAPPETTDEGVAGVSSGGEPSLLRGSARNTAEGVADKSAACGGLGAQGETSPPCTNADCNRRLASLEFRLSNIERILQEKLRG